MQISFLVFELQNLHNQPLDYHSLNLKCMQCFSHIVTLNVNYSPVNYIYFFVYNLNIVIFCTNPFRRNNKGYHNATFLSVFLSDQHEHTILLFTTRHYFTFYNITHHLVLCKFFKVNHPFLAHIKFN